MSRPESIEADKFAAGLKDILADIDNAVDEAVEEGVRAGARKAASEWRRNAATTLGGDAYRKSIRTSTSLKSGEPKATVYSTMPGLPHLLEKGHATIGGGRVKAYVHIEPAAESGFEEAYETVKEAMDRL